MITPEQTQALTSFGTMLGIIIVAIRTELRAKKALAEHKTTQQAVAKVETLVNGPLTASLRATSDALAHVAKLTGDDTDILAAIAARKRSDEHQEQSRAIAEFKSTIVNK